MAGGKRELTVVIAGDADGAKKAFGEVERASRGMGQQIVSAGRVIGAAFVASGIAATAFGVKAVSAASDLEETLSKVGVVFGDQQKQVTAFADQMAKDFGLPKRAILDAASSIGLVGKASGLAQADAAKMSTELARLASDASSFYNVPLEEALGAIQSGLVGEAEPLRRFGVLLSEAAVQEEAVRLGIAKAGEALTEQQKVQARSSLIMRGMGDASGDLERTQGSLANRLRELRGRFENFSASVGQKLLPIVLAGADALENMAKVVGPVLGDALGKVREVVGGVIERFGGLSGILDKLKGVARAVGGFVKENLTAVLAGLGVVVSAGVVAALSALVVAVGALLSPFVLLVGGLAAVTTGLVAAYNRFEGFRTVVNAVVGFVTGTVVPGFVALAKVVGDAVGDAVAFAKRIWPQVSEAIGHVLNVVAGIIRTFVDVVSALWRAWGDDLLRIVRAAFDFVRDSVNNALQIVSGIFRTILAVINGDWGRAWEAIKSVFSAVWDQIKNIAGTGVEFVRSLLAGVLSTIQQVWSGAWGAVRDVFSEVWQAIRDTVATGVRFVVDTFLGIVEVIVKAAADAFGWVPGIGPKLQEAASKVEQFRDETNAALRGIKDKEVKITFKGGGGGDFGGRGASGSWGDGEGLENLRPIGSGYRAAIANLRESGLPFRVTSTWRPGAMTSSGNLSLHAIGKAADFVGPNMRAIGAWFLQQAGSLRELIGPFERGVKNGRVVPMSFFGAEVQRQHQNHVHVGTYHSGGIVRGRPGEEVLALLEAGERVVPRIEAAREGSTVVVHNHFTITASAPNYLGETSEVVTALAEPIMRELRRNVARNGTQYF